MAYESKFKRADIDELFEAVLTLKDSEDCYRFFEDICTINEIHAIAQRLQVAKLLSEKKTYNEIESMTSASTATISRINKCMLCKPPFFPVSFQKIIIILCSIRWSYRSSNFGIVVNSLIQKNISALVCNSCKTHCYCVRALC